MKRIGLFVALLLILLAPSSLALAASRYDRIIRSGETVDESITVIDNDLTIEEGGTVNGDVTVFDGDANIAGTVTGNVSIFNGNSVVSGNIGGDLVLFGGDVDLAEGTSVGGSCFTFGGTVADDSDSVSCATFGGHFNPSQVLGSLTPPTMPPHPEMPGPPRFETNGPPIASRLSYFLLDVSEVVGRSLLMGVLALLVAAVFPRQLRRVSDTIRRKPAASGAVGVLTAIAGPSLIVLLLVLLAITCVGLILYPAVFLLVLVLIAAALMGWVAVGDVIGQMVFDALGIGESARSLAAALGTAALTFLLGGLGLLPFVWGESLLIFLLVCVGLGAAALTQFGIKRYPPGAPPQDSDKVGATLKTLPSK